MELEGFQVHSLNVKHLFNIDEIPRRNLTSTNEENHKYWRADHQLSEVSGCLAKPGPALSGSSPKLPPKEQKSRADLQK